MARFPSFKGFVESPREDTWRLRRSHEQTPVSPRKRTLRRVPAGRPPHCAVSGPSIGSPLNICSFASSIVSLFVQEKALLMSVSEFRWYFPRQVKCHPTHLCVSIAPSLLRPRRKPCQFGEKCSSPPSATVSLAIAAKKTFPPKANNVNDACAHHSTCPLRLSIRLPFEKVCPAWCMERSLCVYQDRDQLPLRTCIFLCCFRDFFHPNAFESSGSHRQIRW